MAKLTSKMQRQLDSLDSAANGGLPVTLKRFILMSTNALRHRVFGCPDLYTRAELQEYIDTLRDLIDTKVHSR